MTRATLIERILRDVYGGVPSDDRDISDNEVNLYINDGVAIAAKQCWKENIQIEGIGYLNNSFYITFKGLAITQDTGGTGYWKCTLPQIPFGLGRNEGLKSVKIKDGTNPFLSVSVIFLNADQWEYVDTLPKPNGIFAKNEGSTLLFKMDTGILLYQTTATVTMASGGDSTSLSSELNVPDDYIPIVHDYVVGKLVFERNQPKDISNDGTDNK